MSRATISHCTTKLESVRQRQLIPEAERPAIGGKHYGRGGRRDRNA